MRPRIGVTARMTMAPRGLESYQINSEYMNAVRLAGADPYLLPWASDQHGATEFLKRVHGVVFTGGEDLHPHYYGQTPHARTFPGRLEKSASDMAYMWAALREDKPLLGICLGFQELNVACGGTLKQHVAGHGGVLMKAKIAPGYLRKLLGKKPLVNHYHHQSIDQVGRGLRVLGHSGGLIEAMDLPGHRMALGVQWHPEALTANPGQLGIFKMLVEEAGK